MTRKNQKKCPYCHNKIGKTYYALVSSKFYTSDDEYIEAIANINSDDKTLLLTIADCYEEYSDEIKINYCPICGRNLRK